MKTLLRYTVGLVLCLLCHSSFGNHVLGGNITFNSIDDNLYEIKLTLLTDCFGATNPAASTNLFFLADGGSCLGFSGSAELGSVHEVSDLLPLELNQSTCGDGLLPGVFRMEYVMIGENAAFLDPTCNWTISWNAADWTNFQNVSMPEGSTAYFRTSIDQSLGTVQGMDLTDVYVPNMRVDEFEDYQIEFQIPEGLSLNFEMEAIRISDGPVSSVAAPYVEPYSAEEPIEAILIDAATGVLSVVSPDILGKYALGVSIIASDGNVEVFNILHSFAIEVRLCDSGTLVLNEGLISNVTEDIVVSGDTLFVEEGQTVCFDVVATNLAEGNPTIESDFESFFGNGSSILTDTNPAVWTGCVPGDLVLGYSTTIEFTISGIGGCGEQEYTAEATIVVVESAGCTDSEACNYHAQALTDDGTCLYEDECGDCGGSGIFGCGDPQACNWLFGASCGNESCVYSSPPDPANVNSNDILAYLSENGNVGSCGYDLNGDGIVNLQDLLILLSWF
jgi:hypothetical protein